MKIEIEINDKQERFLRQFAQKQHEEARDNLGTRKPIHLVQSKRLVYKYDGGGNGDYDVYLCCPEYENEPFPDERAVVLKYGDYDDPDKVVDYETAFADGVDGEFINDENDYFRAYGVYEDIIKCSVDIEYDTVAYFFILENAREYIKYQGHNLTDPKTFTVSGGYSNKGEYESFYDLLMSVGMKLLGGDEK